MKHVAPLTMSILFFGVCLGSMPALAAPQDTKEKTCRMEQQCHWENFKKICVYVKVCR